MEERDRADRELLGYSAKWVDYGFLSPELLRDQVERFHSSDDKNTEHYRYRTFWQFRRRDTFSIEELEHYLELAASDPDLAMGRAAIIDLLDHPGLTEAQWETVLAHPRVQELPNLVRRERLLRELRRPDVGEETLWRCLEEGSGSVHRALVELPELPHALLAALQEKGLTRAVRNLARVRLKWESKHDP